MDNFKLNGRLKMGDPVERKCREGTHLGQLDDGEWRCFPPPLGRKKEMVIGVGRDDCPEGFLRVKDRDDDYFCIPCETVKYTCPDSGTAVLEKCLCVPEERYGSIVMSKEEASRKSAEAARDLLGKNCQIHSKGFFFNAFEKWKSQLTRTAEYRCITKLPYREEAVVTREVSVPLVIGEKEEVTRARLEQTARSLTKTINGCMEVKFSGLRPTDEEQARAAREYKAPKLWMNLEEFLGSK